MMSLFPAELLSDLQRLPGADYSFLKQLSGPSGAPLRERLQEIAGGVGPALAQRWADHLGSLDNRRFFQGFAEAMTAGLLAPAGWTFSSLAWPGPALRARAPDGRAVNVMVLAFIRQVRPLPDQRTVRRLLQALNRVDSHSRIAVLVQRWIPHDFDPEPVRRAVELWLRDTDRHGIRDRYAIYSDEHVSLEFALTGEQASGGQAVVALALGPVEGQRTLEVVEGRVLHELDAYRMGAHGEEPVLVAAVSEQPWRLSGGWLREMLYGKPRRIAGDRALEMIFGPLDRVGDAPSLFRDSVYRMASGVLFADRPAAPADSPLAARARGYLSPWATQPLAPDLFPFPCLAQTRQEDDQPVLAWTGR